MKNIKEIKNSQILLTIILVVFVLTRQLFEGNIVIYAFSILAIGVLFTSVDTQKRKNMVVLLIFISLLVFFNAAKIFSKENVVYIGIICLGIFFNGIFSVIKRLFSRNTITVNEIFGIINCYIMLALAFSFGYSIINFYNPLAFNIPEYCDDSNIALTYYSFVTLTTLGYGDITPRTHLAQNVTILASVFGQFYIAVVVSYLVSRLKKD